jgi:hypothetical protein
MIERFLGRELDDEEQTVLRHVETEWSVTNIREQDQASGWAFTIGLFENFGHPEVTIFGMNERRMWDLMKALSGDSAPPAPYAQFAELVESVRGE